MPTKQTLEIRWFNEGQLPANIQQWFWNDCPGKPEQPIDSPEEREDYYLYLPKCEILSFKFRENNLEIKWRKDEFSIDNFLKNINTYNPRTAWKGKVERWLKFNYSNNSFKDTLNSDNDKNQTWITVKKQRWQRFYKDVEFEIGYLEIKQVDWWTIAVEMEESDTNNKRHFNQTIQEFSQTYSGKNLSTEKSCGYPSWLLQNFSA